MHDKRFWLLSAVLIALSSAAWSAPLTHGWSKRFGSTGDQNAYGVAVDASGNAFVTGQFTGTVDLGGGALTSAGSTDIFLAKYDPAGNHLWSKRFGDASAQYAAGIATDGSGNVILTGYFLGTVNFGGGALTSAGGEDIFVAKFDTNGDFAWSARFGDANWQRPDAVTVDQWGNIVLTGYFSGTVNFGGGVLTSAGFEDIFVAKLSASGSHIWSKRFGDWEGQAGAGVAVDGQGNVVVTGYMMGTVDFGGGALTSAGLNDIFIVKFDANGNHTWSKRFGDETYQYGPRVAVDGSGNVIAAGNFEGTVDFGGGALTSAGSEDLFVAKFDASGNHTWSKRFGGAGSQFALGLTVDGSRHITVAGYFYNDVDFGGGVLTSTGAVDIFVAAFDAQGDHLWSKRFGDVAAQEARSVAADASGNITVTGGFGGTVNFGGSTLTSGGGYDIFLAKFWRAAPIIDAVRDVPGDQGGVVNVAWGASGCDTPAEHVITKYTVWRAIEPSLVSEFVAKGIPITSSFVDVGAWESGTSLIRIEQVGATTYYWYLISSHDAYYLAGYSAPVPTLFDWTEDTQEYHYFQIIAHTSTPYVFYTSDPDSGCSVDNLAPTPPLGLAGEQSTLPLGIALTWKANHEADLSHYAVYRGTTPGFVPGSGNLMATSPDTTIFDGGWRWNSGYYYKLSAIDVHGNEGGFALLSPGDVTGIGDTPLPIASYLEQNTPNPFGASTRVVFGLSEASNVTLSVYDVSGRVVRALANGPRSADRHEIVWDGRDDRNKPVASGVYFLKLEVGAFSQTKKMVVAR